MNKDYFYLTKLKTKKTKPYRLRVQLNGKRSIHYFDSPEQAESYKEKLKHEKSHRYKKGDIEYFTVNAMFDELIKEKQYELSESTIIQKKSNFANVFQSIRLEWLHLINENQCWDILNAAPKNSGLSMFSAFQTLDEINKLAKRRFKYGFNWDISNLRKKIKIRRGGRKKSREYNTEAEIKKILSCLKANPDFEIYYHIYVLGLNIGCRIGELCSLKKLNFNEQEKSILVNSTISTSIKEKYKDSLETKTKENRSVQLSNSAVAAIKYLSKKSNTQFVIPSLNKEFDFCLTRNISAFFKPLFLKLTIPWIGTHGMFRKTFATQMALHSKKPHKDMIEAIQKHLGHKSPQMTLHYIQAIDNSLEEELIFFDNLSV